MKINGKVVYIDKNGMVVTKIKYDFIAPFKDGLGAVVLNCLWGLVDKTGKEVLEIVFPEFIVKSNL